MDFSRIFSRCSECKALFALKKQEVNIARKEDVKILESLTQPTLKGEIETMVDRFVLGERIFYETQYVCRRCGAKTAKTTWKDIKK